MARKMELPPEAAMRLSAASGDAPAPRPLPATLDEALDALEQTAAAREWFGPVYLEAYLRAKRAEAANTKDIDPVVLCARYAEAY